MEAHRVDLWGAADLRDLPTPLDGTGHAFPSALTWVVKVNPLIMAGIRTGPTQEYADEYDRINGRINALARLIEAKIAARGFRAHALGASERTDPLNIKGDFPHKTASTRAGLGWIGRHCQLVTRSFGSWVRLGTVFTDMPLCFGQPLERSFCGRCTRCVDACPANALTGKIWYPGVPREELLDVHVCDQWKKRHYFRYHQGHVCGICSAVCPYGSRSLNRSA
jgi:epoxyqueuosine reductase QueG